MQALWIRRAWLLQLLLGLALAAPMAHAVPSFARQTGMACEACHTVFPELSHFGRMFKANAYTLDNLKQVRDIDSTKQELLSLATPPPLAAMVPPAYRLAPPAMDLPPQARMNIRGSRASTCNIS